jgi:hypothetical protein
MCVNLSKLTGTPQLAPIDVAVLQMSCKYSLIIKLSWPLICFQFLWITGGSGVGAQEQGGPEDARLRPRRAHRNAARRRQDPP